MMNSHEPTISDALDAHAAAALERHKQSVDHSMAQIAARSTSYDRHDLAAVREASALVSDLTRRHPLALNVQVIFLLNEILHDLKRVEHHVEWGMG